MFPLVFSYSNKNHSSKKTLFFEINSSEGGRESNSCAQILYKMYVKFFDKNKIEYTIITKDETPEGVNRIIFEIKGKGELFEKLLKESGNHKFIRKSPYSKQKKIHTSFVKINVSEKKEKEKSIINDSDIKIKFFKGTGAGGQHRNKVETGVRLTHITTGIVVESVSERSQKQNREIAYNKLISKINELDNEKNDKKRQENWNNKSNYGFGEKTRTYKIDESTIKDEETGKMFFQISKILSGDIEKILR